MAFFFFFKFPSFGCSLLSFVIKGEGKTNNKKPTLSFPHFLQMFWGWPGNARSRRLRAALLESLGTAVATHSLLFPSCLRQNPCSEVLLNFFVGIFFIFFPLFLPQGLRQGFSWLPPQIRFPGWRSPVALMQPPWGPSVLLSLASLGF